MKKIKNLLLVLLMFLGSISIANALAIDIYYCDGKVVGVNVYDDGSDAINITLIK